MIAQIRTGLWVRNGFAIRGQLLHYRDYMLRELCYDQDLYLLQTALIVLPSDLVSLQSRPLRTISPLYWELPTKVSSWGAWLKKCSIC